jgi:hypothetical protein
MLTEKAATIEAAAVAEATRLCDHALAVLARPLALGGMPSAEHRARAKRYQKDEFLCTSRKVERAVYELFTRDEWTSRDELLAALPIYCAAGIAEVERRFRELTPAKEG